jgi:hypothetical protein
METKHALEDVLHSIIVLDHFIHCLFFRTIPSALRRL